MEKIFISYAREDKAHARRLYEDLRKLGLDPWIDFENLTPGRKWKNEIQQAIAEASYFLAILSSKSISKIGFVQREWKIAFILIIIANIFNYLTWFTFVYSGSRMTALSFAFL